VTTLGPDSEHGAGSLLLGSRYRLEAVPGSDRGAPVLVHGVDEASGRAVTLLLLPGSSSMLERLALRSQARRFAEIEHPGVATVLDVVDTRESLAVVLAHAPGARLLADGWALGGDGIEQLASALRAVHAIGRVHGALDEHAVLVRQESTVQLLPLPPDAAAHPEEDLRALEALAARRGSGAPRGTRGVPPQRTAPPFAPPVAPPAAEVPGTGGATRLARSADTARRSWAAGGRRAAVIVGGACGGALLADLLSRLVT
jgi:hypothetical protein